MKLALKDRVRLACIAVNRQMGNEGEVAIEVQVTQEPRRGFSATKRR